MLNIEQLNEKSNDIRKLVVRQVYKAQSGHPGGSLGVADIIATLYFNEMNVDSKNPKWEDRDRLVLSKGHTCPALYAALAMKGFFDVKDLDTFRQIDSFLEGHPSMLKIPGIDISTGSLGQGLSVANGMALSAKLNNKDYRVFAILGDGEIEEGQVWEAAMTSAHYKLDNVCAFVDYNGLQIDGPTTEVMNSSPIDEKFKAFGWNVVKIDGHNVEEISEAVKKANEEKGRPTVIVAKTVKGKGVLFMENQAGWHGKAPNDDEYTKAISELGGEF